MESTDLFLKLQKSTPSLQQVIVFSSNQKRENWEGLEKISELEEFGNAQPFQVRPLAKNGIVSIIHTRYKIRNHDRKLLYSFLNLVGVQESRKGRHLPIST